MDIDCDGANNSAGACSNDPSGQGETAFKDTVQSFGIDDLDANIHPYVVFGNEGADPSFSPEQFGMQPLSVVAVVCNNQVVSLHLLGHFAALEAQMVLTSKSVLRNLGRHQRFHFHRRISHFNGQPLLP